MYACIMKCLYMNVCMYCMFVVDMRSVFNEIHSNFVDALYRRSVRSNAEAEKRRVPLN